MRLFLALDLPESARVEVARWRDAVIGGRGDLRPVAAESLHVTLVFLGEKPESVVAPLWSAVVGAAATHRASVLAPLGVRPVPRRRPNLYALDLADEGGRASDLHRSVAGALAEADLHPAEARPFWPHVTLARVRRRARPQRWRDGESPLPGRFTSRLLTLYESQTSPAGARYRIVERLELAV